MATIPGPPMSSPAAAAGWRTACSGSGPMIRAAAPTWDMTGCGIRVRDQRPAIARGAPQAPLFLLPEPFVTGDIEAPILEPDREAVMAMLVSRIRAVLVIVVLGLTVSACGYNNIPTFEEQAKAKGSDVQNNYQRRADLIP